MDIAQTSYTSLHTRAWEQNDNQGWYLSPAEDNQFLIKNKTSGQSLKLAGDLIIQQTCNTRDPLQRFILKKCFMSTIIPGNWAIVNKKDLSCLSYAAHFTDVASSACGKETTIFWKFELQDDYTHIITSVFSNQVLDVSGGSENDGAVILSSSAGGWFVSIKDNQQWFIDYVDDFEFFVMRALHSNKCLTLKEHKYIQTSCNTKNPAQLFKVTQQDVKSISENIYFSIINKSSNFCLRWQDTNADIIHSACDLAELNFWKFENYGNWYIIKSIVNNQILNATDEINDRGVLVNTRDRKDLANQKWFVEYINDEWFMLRSLKSNKCLSTLKEKFSQGYCDAKDSWQLFKLNERPELPALNNHKTAIVKKVTKKCLEYNTKDESKVFHFEFIWSYKYIYWTFEKIENLYIIRTGVNYVTVLQVDNNLNGSNIKIGWSLFTTSSEQKWTVDYVDFNYFMLRNFKSGKCLTVTDSFFTQNTCSSTDDSQLFVIQRDPSAPENVSPKEDAPENVSPEEDAPENVSPEEDAPENVSPEEDAPENVSPKDDTYEESRDVKLTRIFVIIIVLLIFTHFYTLKLNIINIINKKIC
jgi:hypothetical protein